MVNLPVGEFKWGGTSTNRLATVSKEDMRKRFFQISAISDKDFLETSLDGSNNPFYKTIPHLRIREDSVSSGSSLFRYIFDIAGGKVALSLKI